MANEHEGSGQADQVDLAAQIEELKETADLTITLLNDIKSLLVQVLTIVEDGQAVA